MAEYASKGVGGAGLGLGIAGTSLGLLNGGLGNLLGGMGNCGCGNSDNMPVNRRFFRHYISTRRTEAALCNGATMLREH